MKKIFNIFFFFLFLTSLFTFIPKAFAEEIKEFSATININKNGTIRVEEKIVYDFGSQQRHGIFREIPFIKKNQEGKKYRLEFSDFKVVDEAGAPHLFKKIQEGEKIKIKIGDPNKTVSGIQTYIISYQVAGALSYFSDHDELYWNVTGNNWQAPIEKTSTSVVLPALIDQNQLKIDCLTGVFGSSLKECQYQLLNGRDQVGTVVNFSSSREFMAGEGLTIVVGFPKNIVSVLEPEEYRSFWESFLGRIIVFLFYLGIFIWYVGLPFYIIYRWFKYGRDPRPVGFGEARAWFDPPKTPKEDRFLTPAEVGVLGDETVDLKDISATIVDLARRGYLWIEERKKGEFWLVKTNKENKDLLPFESDLINKFFGEDSEFNLRKKTLYQPVEAVKKSIYQEVVKGGLFPEDPEKIRTRMTILAFFGLITGSLFLALVSFVFGRRLPRKTIEGVKAKNIAFSLRNFLRSQERQLTFQADKQMMFEKLLPYAIVFGVEKIWAKRFSNLDLKPPEWYRTYDQRTFNTMLFTNSLNSSLSSFRSSATPPTSTRSTRGFSSGFSGGFSGGGGGGGGGGSW